MSPTFYWADETEEAKAKTLFSLVKNNQGMWKSEKQRDYLLGLWSHSMKPQFAAKRHSIPFESHQSLIFIHGHLHVTNKQGQSYPLKPITYAFLCDEKGILTEYKIGYDGKGKPLKTEECWKREETKTV